MASSQPQQVSASSEESSEVRVLDSNEPLVTASSSVPSSAQVIDSSEPLVSSTVSRVQVIEPDELLVQMAQGEEERLNMYCCNCTEPLSANQQLYHALDIGPDVINIIEEWRNEEVLEGDILCQNCLERVFMELDRREMLISNENLNHCICCDISLLRQTGRRSRLIPEGRPERAYIASLIHPREIPANARVCNRCWQRAHTNRHVQLDVHAPQPEVRERAPAFDDAPQPEVREPAPAFDDAPQPEVREPAPAFDDAPQPEVRESTPAVDVDVPQREYIHLNNYRRLSNTPNHCFVPECTNAERLRVPIQIKKKLLKEKKLYIPEGCRICALHSATYNWDFMDQYEFIFNSFNNTDIKKMIELSESSDELIDFENVENMNDATCNYWTGLTVINFLIIFRLLQQHLCNLCKKPKKALGIYLVKLRTGDSFARIASVFLLSETMAQTYVRNVRNCLRQYYVPLHLGLQHITREAISVRNLLIPQGIFGTEARNPIIICDGSYIYMQKSSNYLFQKKSYSLHKYRNLVKPMMFVATDGHIIDVYGPYAATDSDADIMNRLFQNEDSELREYFQSHDIFILDRGFRDALGLLSSLGYAIYKPHSLSRGESQLSTRQANESRLVTMCRWVVEIVNGRFKRDYKIFRSEYFNRMSRNLIADFRNAAAILNHFHPVITDRIDSQLILNRALAMRYRHNFLADHVISQNLNRHQVNFVHIDSQIPSLDMFPMMQMSDLILFCLGTYQLKQARSYYGEHIRATGSFYVQVCTYINTVFVPDVSATEPVLIRGRIKSRHHTRTVYHTYILLDTVSNDWQESIRAYYCSCIIGKRTVGSCAHVATIVWYLGWARYQDNIAPPASFLDGILVRDDI